MSDHSQHDEGNAPAHWVGSKDGTGNEYAESETAYEVHTRQIGWMFFEVFHGLIIA